VTRLRSWRPLLHSEYGEGIFLFVTSSTTLPIKCVAVAHSPGVKRPGREADHSPPSTSEIKNTWSYTSTPHTNSWCDTWLRPRTNLPLPLIKFQLRLITKHWNDWRESRQSSVMKPVSWHQTPPEYKLEATCPIKRYWEHVKIKTILFNDIVSCSPAVFITWNEADHSPPSTSEIKNTWSYTSTPPYVITVWCLVKHVTSLPFTFTFTALHNIPPVWFLCSRFPFDDKLIQKTIASFSCFHDCIFFDEKP